jgi:chromosome segregation ATPase
MIRAPILILLWLVFLAGPAFSQDPDKQDLDERFARVNSAVEGLLASNADLQKRIDRLENDLRAAQQTAREAQEREATNTATNDQLRKLFEDIKEVDRRREMDKQLILEQLDKISKALAEEIAARAAQPPVAPPVSRVAEKEKGLEYTIQPRDTLGEIVQSVNAKLREKHLRAITQKDVLEANPGLNPNVLRKGRKIFIPLPPPE